MDYVAQLRIVVNSSLGTKPVYDGYYGRLWTIAIAISADFRIRHYGLFANANRAENIATARALLHIIPPADPPKQPDITPNALRVLPCPCPRCGARMIVIEAFARGCEPRWCPMPSMVDTS